MLRNKKAMVEECDERNKFIEGRAAVMALGVQTLALFTCLFLLAFMGCLSYAAALALAGLLLLGVLVFVGCDLHYKKQ